MGYVDGSKQTGGRAYRQHTTLKETVRKKFNYTCQLCGQPGREVDHIIPYNVSHDSSLSNLRVLCKACNLSIRRQRRDANPFKTMDDYYAYLQFELDKEKSTGIS